MTFLPPPPRAAEEHERAEKSRGKVDRAMTALVVYESMFGNTEAIAGAIADGIAEHIPVRLVEVREAPSVIPDDVELLVVGGPTHAFRTSTAPSRDAAVEQSCDGTAHVGLREWLAALSAGSGGVAAVFDTLAERPRWIGGSGAAGRGAETELRRLGYRVEVPAAHFFVGATAGALVEGEEERAHRWGERIGASLGARITR
jgi:hypothetical protein